MMERLFNLWNRIRKFNPRELTTTQLVVGITGTIIALWFIAQFLSFIVGILNILAPIALLTLVGYFGYNWMQSRSEDIDPEMTKSKEQKAVDEAIANYRASLEQNEAFDSASVNTSSQVDVTSENAVNNLVDTAIEDDIDDEKLVIKQIVNPETGFKEPDIARLIEHEEQKLKEADKVNDDIMAQIEARRKRLQNNNN